MEEGREEEEDGEGKKLPLTSAPCAWRFLLSRFRLFSTPTRAPAAETLTLERTLGDFDNEAYGLTPEEIELMWKTAPLRRPIPQTAG